MKLLITGTNGQLGWELARQVGATGLDAVLFDRHGFDITDREGIGRIVAAEAPDLLINAAAYTQVDLAESQSAAANAVNRDGPGYLAEACAVVGIPMIHISTDYVFDGTCREAYPESLPVSPTGVYGKSKAEGELLVRQTLARHLIIRTSWVYGVHGNNFVKTMLRLGKEKPEIGVVSDQSGSPTSAADLARALLALAGHIREGKETAWGIYHYCGRGITTWFDFARTIFLTARRFGYPHDPLVTPISTAAYPTAARRPAFSALDCRRISDCFGISSRPWEEALTEMIEELLAQP